MRTNLCYNYYTKSMVKEDVKISEMNLNNQIPLKLQNCKFSSPLSCQNLAQLYFCTTTKTHDNYVFVCHVISCQASFHSSLYLSKW